jgi:hypothetical protein
MSVLRKFNNRILVWVLFLLACCRSLVSFGYSLTPGNQSRRGTQAFSSAKEELLLLSQLVRREAGTQRYALERTGTFPYARLTPYSTDSFPVPIEIASFSSPMPFEGSNVLDLVPHSLAPAAAPILDLEGSLAHPLGGNISPMYFCPASSCSSCSSCGGCIDCAIS